MIQLTVKQADVIRQKIDAARPGDIVVVLTEAQWETAHEAHQVMCPTKLIDLRWIDSDTGQSIKSCALGQITRPSVD